MEANRQRNPGLDVRLAAAEDLPFGDATFDHALAQMVVNFMADAERGVGEMRRVTRPSGHVSAAVWDYRGGMTLLRTFWDAVAATDPNGADSDERTVMRNATPDELRAVWETVGLRDVVTSEALVSAAYSNFGDLWRPFEAGVGPAGVYFVALPSEDRASDEPFRLTARAWLVTGVVPWGRGPA